MNFGFKALSQTHLFVQNLFEKIGFEGKQTLGDFFDKELDSLNFCIDDVVEMEPSPPPWFFDILSIDLSLSLVKKETMPVRILRRLANHKIQALSHSNIFYTDGSKRDDITGYAVVHEGEVVQERIQNHCSVFDAELLAIRKAVRIAQVKDGDSVIISDSLSSLLALSNPNSKNPVIVNIQRILSQSPQPISFLFVHSHIGVTGNDAADEEAKLALDLRCPTDMSTGLYDLKRLVSNHLKTMRQNEWVNLDPGNKLKKHYRECPTNMNQISMKRKDFTVLSRLRIGHTKLTHSYLFKTPHILPQCEDCNVDLTIDHIVLDCNKFSSVRNKIFTDLNPHVVFSHSKYDTENLLSFIKEIGLYLEV